VAGDSSEGHLGLELVERYQLAEVLAQGALCPVYRGQDTILRRPVAVKAVPPELCEVYRASLAATTTLMHPATIALYDAIEHDGWLFLVQEYVAAKSLDTYLKQGVPSARAVDIGLQLAKALDHVHRREMAHGDLTPTAVLVDRHAVVRINNFGLPPDDEYFARMRAMVAAAARDDDATIIQAPGESGVAAERGNEPRTEDVRAVGYLLWQLLSEPRGVDSEGPRDLRPDVPESVAVLLRRCCGVPGEEPLTSAGALLLALEEVAERLAKERPANSTVTPPALRAARAAVEEAAAWAMEETLASNQIFASSAPGKLGQAPSPVGSAASAASISSIPTIPVETPSGDLAATRPALDAEGVMRPGLRLPARPLDDEDTYPPLPERDTRPDAEWPGRVYARTAPPARSSLGGGLSLGMVLLIGGLLFVIFFLIGYLVPFVFSSGR